MAIFLNDLTIHKISQSDFVTSRHRLRKVDLTAFKRNRLAHLEITKRDRDTIALINSDRRDYVTGL